MFENGKRMHALRRQGPRGEFRVTAGNDSERLDILFHNQNGFLSEFAKQLALELAKELASGSNMTSQHTEDHDLVAKNDIAHFPEALVRLWKNVQPANSSRRRSPSRSISSSETGVPSLRNSGTYSSYSFTRADSCGSPIARDLLKVDAGVSQTACGSVRNDEGVIGQYGPWRMSNQEPPGSSPIAIACANENVHGGLLLFALS